MCKVQRQCSLTKGKMEAKMSSLCKIHIICTEYPPWAISTEHHGIFITHNSTGLSDFSSSQMKAENYGNQKAYTLQYIIINFK